MAGGCGCGPSPPVDASPPAEANASSAARLKTPKISKPQNSQDSQNHMTQWRRVSGQVLALLLRCKLLSASRAQLRLSMAATWAAEAAAQAASTEVLEKAKKAEAMREGQSRRSAFAHVHARFRRFCFRRETDVVVVVAL